VICNFLLFVKICTAKNLVETVILTNVLRSPRYEQVDDFSSLYVSFAFFRGLPELCGYYFYERTYAFAREASRSCSSV